MNIVLAFLSRRQHARKDSDRPEICTDQGWIHDFGHGGGGGVLLLKRGGFACVRGTFFALFMRIQGGGAPQTFFLFYSVHCASE